MEQAGADQDMEREQMGKDADAARDEGGNQADHERQMEVEKKKPKKEEKNIRTLNRLKKYIIQESGDRNGKISSIDRIINRNIGNH